jgi:hypothetical protein
VAAGKYRLLFKPSAAVSIVGDNRYNSTDNTKTKKWHITANAPATAATYKIYKYNGANACLSEVARQNVYIGDGNRGDYLYSDGTSGTETSGKSIVGIIFSDQLTPAQYTDGCKYGKAIALKNANDGNICHWASVSNSPYSDQTVHPYCQNYKLCYDDISSGYDALSANSSYVTTSTNEAWYKCYTYKDGTTHSGSLEGKNWYLPSIGEWWDVIENLGIWSSTELSTIKGMRTSTNDWSELIGNLSGTYFSGLNTKLTAASGNTIVPSDECVFWSASELYDSGSGVSGVVVGFLSSYNDVIVYYNTKASDDYVRAVLAY